VGAFASRVTVMTGAAVMMAAEKLRREMLAVAGRLLQSAPERLSIVGDRVVVGDTPDGPSLDLAAIAQGAGGEIAAEATFTTQHMTYPYGVHLAQVRIERDSCAIVVERFFVGYDIGRSINPMLVEGQILGGAVQGIGAALMEEFVYDASGQPLSVTFADYLMPTIAEVPPIEVALFEDAPTPLNPLGVKGAGEAGINAVGAAIAAAVDDALGMPGAVRQLPITPNRLHTLLRAADGPSFVFETHNIPCKTNPLGVKGAGEAGAIGSCPAVVNAIIEGLWREYKIDHIDMPATPERVWIAIREHQRRHSL
jgi:CO/xanthine dehydrogenase Mo-binding subunit